MNAYITLDYELFMGSNPGTPEQCLVAPMEYLTNVTDRYGIKLNVFVDAAYLLRLYQLKENDESIRSDYDLVVNNIKRLDEKGHSIQMHLHPQWLFSDFVDGKWRMDKDYYKLSNLPIADQEELIKESATLLNSVVSKPVSAFRAGGYSLSNFGELADTFMGVGINIDSSVLRGEKIRSHYQTYDYSRIPNLSSYSFSDCIQQEDRLGSFIEYPISTVVVPSLSFLFRKFFLNCCGRRGPFSRATWGDGIGIGYAGNKFQILIQKLNKLFGTKSIRASIDNGMDLEKVYNYSKKHYLGGDFVIIGHPKAISPFSVAALERFIINHPEIDFRTF